MRIALLLAVSLLMSPSLHAKPGGGIGAAVSLRGLCTGRLSAYRAQLCAAMREEIENIKSCEIRLKKTWIRAGEPGENLLDSLIRQPQTLESMKVGCSSVETVAQDRGRFSLYLQQVFAALINEESHWSNTSTSWMGAKGLGQLSRSSARVYSKCSQACAVLGSKRGNVKKDDFNNVRCTAAIGMFWMAYDQTLGHGRSGRKATRKRKARASTLAGLARYFQPYRDIDRHKRRSQQRQLAYYCENRLDKDWAASQSGTVTYMDRSRNLQSLTTRPWQSVLALLGRSK